jgi:hypothetical protein
MKKILIFATLASIAIVVACYLAIEREDMEDLYLPF